MSPLSGVLGEAWALYKRHAAHFILIALAIYVVVAVITALLSLVLGSFGAILGGLLSLLGTFLLQAALVKAVQDARDGRRDLDLRASVQAALPFLLPVTIAGLFAAIAIGVGFALLIVPGLILLTFLSLIVPWIVVGGATAFESFGKSWATVRGYAWQVFGTYAVVLLILIVGEIVLGVILYALPAAASNSISDVVMGTLVAPFLAAVVTLVYDRLTVAHGQQTEAGMPQGSPPADGYGQYDGA